MAIPSHKKVVGNDLMKTLKELMRERQLLTQKANIRKQNLGALRQKLANLEQHCNDAKEGTEHESRLVDKSQIRVTQAKQDAEKWAVCAGQLRDDINEVIRVRQANFWRIVNDIDVWEAAMDENIEHIWSNYDSFNEDNVAEREPELARDIQRLCDTIASVKVRVTDCGKKRDRLIREAGLRRHKANSLPAGIKIALIAVVKRDRTMQARALLRAQAERLQLDRELKQWQEQLHDMGLGEGEAMGICMEY